MITKSHMTNMLHKENFVKWLRTLLLILIPPKYWIGYEHEKSFTQNVQLDKVFAKWMSTGCQILLT